MKTSRLLLSIILLAAFACEVYADDNGKVFKLNLPNIEFITPDIVRVQWTKDGVLKDNGTGVCIYKKTNVDVKVTDSPKETTYESSALRVVVNKAGKEYQRVSFVDLNGKTILDQLPQSLSAQPSEILHYTYDENSAHVEETANGKVTVKDVLKVDTIGGASTRYFVTFYSEGEKARYGLGAHMEDYMNLKDKTMYLTQHNLKAMVPVLCSTNGYGLMFDAGCAMVYGDQELYPIKDGCYTMQLEGAKELDYYFIKGENIDKVIAGYHYLTGKPSLMPRYVFGYTQSKERYVSSQDLINTLSEYRRRQVPIDMIVQDWNYWPQGWGYMKMNPKYYPDPKALADSIHAMNAKLMVSIWPNPQWCPEAEDFKSRGMMLEHDVYDVFNPEARKHYWKYANDEFFSKGFDAWWCDSSEPLDGDWNNPPGKQHIYGEYRQYGWNDHKYRFHLNSRVLSEALGVERSSLYSLYHSMGIYENQRLACDTKRVVNLTRSSYSGQQRYGTIVWNGDTHASWESFKQQIPAGLNYMATGNPYWTVDVGSFFTRNDGRRWFYKGEFPDGVKDDAYKDYYVRMFQWGTFLPMLRSHGSDTPREIWRFGEPGTKFYDAILSMIHLRYRLIPYIYSMAAQQTFNSYTMARLLAFDFPEDETVLDMKDEYMFGDILVCPVTEPNATKRKVYLPNGSEWYNYWTNRRYEGGQWIEAEAGIDKLPLYVRAGSIIPTGPVLQYVDEPNNEPLTLNIYPGKDAEFQLYNDAGDGYAYENGDYTMTTIKWNDKKKKVSTTLTHKYNGAKKIKYKVNIIK